MKTVYYTLQQQQQQQWRRAGGSRVWIDNKGELLLNLTLDYNINKTQEDASVVGDAAYLSGHMLKKVLLEKVKMSSVLVTSAIS